MKKVADKAAIIKRPKSIEKATKHKAKCSWCWGKVNTHTTYNKKFGDAVTVYYCKKCFKLLEEWKNL